MAAALPHLVHQRRRAARLLRQRAHVAHILQRQVNTKARLWTDQQEERALGTHVGDPQQHSDTFKLAHLELLL